MTQTITTPAAFGAVRRPGTRPSPPGPASGCSG
ncbi:hypothetical protein P3T35_000556 [Kitasatospora sp. GP30]|nr:hypothetical protein [Kitasatospora sp. GP30]